MSVPLYQAKAEMFRTLGHPARIRVLELLQAGEPFGLRGLASPVGPFQGDEESGVAVRLNPRLCMIFGHLGSPPPRAIIPSRGPWEKRGAHDRMTDATGRTADEDSHDAPPSSASLRAIAQAPSWQLAMRRTARRARWLRTASISGAASREIVRRWRAKPR